MRRIISYLSVYVGDSGVRHNVGILFGMLINSLYIVANLIWGIKHENVWFISVAVYYLLVALLRYFSFEVYSDADSTEQMLGVLMLIISVPMTGMISYTVITSSARGYPKSSLPIFAAYAVFSIARAIFGLFSSKKEGVSPARDSHIIKLSLALLSLFNLQTSLFAYFGFDTPIAVLLNFLTGGSVSLSMLALAKRKISGSK